MKQHPMFPVLALFALALAATAPSAVASTSEGFDALMKPYEAIRLALLEDTVDGVDGEAEAIAEKAKEIADDEATAKNETNLLPRIADSATELAAAPDLPAARRAFFKLSKLMMRYRSKVEGERPVAAYCSMADKSWLQLDDKEIGNPYYGQSMARCGEFVEDEPSPAEG